MTFTLDRPPNQPDANQLQLTPAEFLHQVKTLAQIPNLIEAIATRHIIASTAEEMGIETDPSELQQAADMFRTVNQLQSAESTFSWLQRHHLSLDDFEELISGSVLHMKVADHLFADKVEPYFYEHQLQYEQAALYEIVFEDEDLALEAFYAIQEKESTFAEIARHYIQDKELSRIGGYRGALSRRVLKPEISASVFAASPPMLLKPIITAKGSHLVWVEEIIPAQLSENIKSQIKIELFMNWLKQQAQDVEIKLVDSEKASMRACD